MNIVSQKEIKKLFKRFTRLDKSQSGRINKDEFLAIPELAMNPLAHRVIAIFDLHKDDQVSFKQFVKTLSIFSPKTSEEGKLDFAFKLYDIKADGRIDSDELFQVLKMLTGDNLTEGQLQIIVGKTMRESDKDGDGFISKADFTECFNSFPLGEKMTVIF